VSLLYLFPLLPNPPFWSSTLEGMKTTQDYQILEKKAVRNIQGSAKSLKLLITGVQEI
jgi:hypothetical protein